MRKNSESNVFDVSAFLSEYSDEDLEWQKKHFPNGSLRYEFRDDSDKVSSCRKPYGVGINESGVLYIKRTYPCHVITGSNPCEVCLSVREKKRKKDFSGRIDNVPEGVGLYLCKTRSADDQRRVVQNARYHGYDFLAIPTGDGDEKIIVINGPVKGSAGISRDDAKRLVSSCANVLMNERRLMVSGKLGKDESLVLADERTGNEIVDVNVRTLIYAGTVVPTAIEVAIANAKVAGRLRAPEEGITLENIQELVSLREKESLAVLRSMGFDCIFSSPQSVKFNIESIRKQWLSIQTSSCLINGEVSGLDDATKYIVTEAVKAQNRFLREVDFDNAVDDASRRMVTANA